MSQSPRNISDALKAASVDGVLESTSSFTLDPAEALRKSGSHQLPKPELWLVKIVQAAVCAGAENIDIKLERACVKVSVRGGVFPSASEVAKQISFESTDSTQGHLLTGLRVLAVEPKTALVLQTREPEPERVVVNEQALPIGHRLEDLPEGVKLDLKVYRRGSILANPKALLAEVSVKNLIRTRAAEYLALVRRCWTSPIPITIDGRPLETRYYCATDGLEEGKLTANLPCSMACAPTPLFEGRPKLVMRRPQKLGDEELPGLFLAKRVYRDTHFLVRDPEQETSALLDIQFGTKDLVVLFVCDGALVTSHRVKLKVPAFRRYPSFAGLRLYVQVEPHELDLSEFQVRDVEVLVQQAFQASLPTFLQLWNDLMEFRGRIALRRPGRESKQRGVERGLAILGGVAGLGTGAAAGVSGAIFFGGYLAAAGGWYVDIIHYMYGHVYGRMFMAGQARPILKESLLYWDTHLQKTSVRAWKHANKTTPLQTLTTNGLSHSPIRASGRGLWAVKLVQAAVSSKASGMNFMFSASEVTVQFHGVQQLSQPGETYLAEALCEVWREEFSEIILVTAQATTTWSKDAVVCDPESCGELEFRLVLEKPKGGVAAWIKRKVQGPSRFTAEAIRYLTEYAWVSPVEIRLDQRALETRYSHKRQGFTEIYMDHLQRGIPVGLLRVTLPPTELGPNLPLPAQHLTSPSEAARKGKLDVVTHKMKLPDTFSFWSGELEGQCGGVVVINGDLRANSAVEFVLDGVIVDVQALYDSEDFRDQKGVMKGLRLLKMLPVPRVGLRCLVPIVAGDLEDGRVKEPLKRSRLFLTRVAPLLKELLSHLTEQLSQLRYSSTLPEFKDKFQGRHGKNDKYIARGDAVREQKLMKPFHAKDLKKGVEALPSYLDRWLESDS